MNSEGRSAVVTGGASGLGAAVARRLAERGAQVVIADRDAERGEALAGELGGAAEFVRCDVTDEAEMREAVRRAAERAPLALLACCAGIGTVGRVLGRSGPHELAAFARVVHINLVGTFNAIRLAAEAMARNEPNAEGERGVVVNTASIAAFEGQVGQAAYSASKGGIVGMTLPIARELAEHGIRVVTVAPGVFDTPMLAGVPDAVRESLGAGVPFPPRLGRPDEFAALVLHVLENPLLNGTTIRLDGALRMPPR